MADSMKDPTVVGGVLCGGASRRMGTNKALLEFGGAPLASHVAAMLIEGGAQSVVALGGDPATLAATKLAVVPDTRSDGGPLAGVLGGMDHFDRSQSSDSDDRYIAVFAACDLPWLTGELVAVLVSQVVAGAQVAVAEVDGEPQWHLSAVSSAARPGLQASWSKGVRSLRGAFGELSPTAVQLVDGLAHLAPTINDVDTPEAWNTVTRKVRAPEPASRNAPRQTDRP